MIKIQSLIESALASLLKQGVIKYSKSVLYMPLPSTPLRADDSNLNTLVEKEFFDDKNRLRTIIDRMISTKDYLNNGGKIYSMHETITELDANKIPGLAIYKNNLQKFPGKLIDTPISKINTRYTGASYIAHCQDGTKIFFAIKSRQEDNTKARQWCLYYGTISNKKLDKYFGKLKEVYKLGAEIPFDFE
jgi:hypothetical protein